MINAQLGRIQVIKISMNTIEVSDTLWAFNNVKYDSCKELIGGANELCQKCKKKTTKKTKKNCKNGRFISVWLEHGQKLHIKFPC